MDLTVKPPTMASVQRLAAIRGEDVADAIPTHPRAVARSFRKPWLKVDYLEHSVKHFALSQLANFRWPAACSAVALGCVLVCSSLAGLATLDAQTVSPEWRRLQQVEVTQEDVISRPQIDQTTPDYILQHQGIAANLQSLQQYLRSLQPSHPRQQEIAAEAAAWVHSLGSENYQRRQEARERLSKMPTLPLAELRAARNSNDPEVRASAAMILEYASQKAPKDSLDGIVQAICQTVIEQQMSGLAVELAETIPLFEQDSTIVALQQALGVSATTEDVALLEGLVRGDNVFLRIAGIEGLVQVQEQQAVEFLAELLQDPQELVKLRAARALANFGDRRAIAGLLQLMNSEDLDIRLKSNRVVRAFTGQSFQYFAFEKPPQRAAALQRWTDWLQAEGAEAALQFPLVELQMVVGRILLSDYSAGKVIELDLDGKVTWEKQIEHPWAVIGLPNGHRLVGQYEKSAIVEFDAAGKEIWRVDDVPGNVMGIDRSENGNTLAACSSDEKIVEYDPAGKLIWERAIAGRPTDAQYLENGNLLVTLMNPHQVVEITRLGERIWELETEANPLQAQRTARGTTIIAHSTLNAAVEYGSDGKEVQRFTSASGTVTSAREMPNGDLVLSTSDKVKRQTREGTVVWEFEGLTYCYNVFPY